MKAEMQLHIITVKVLLFMRFLFLQFCSDQRMVSCPQESTVITDLPDMNYIMYNQEHLETNYDTIALHIVTNTHLFSVQKVNIKL